MKKRAIAVFAALLAAAVGAQATISTYSTTTTVDASQLYSFSYDGTTITPGGVAGFTAGGSFAGAQAGDSFSWTITGATGWNSANAQANLADFNTYAATFTPATSGVGGGATNSIGGVNDGTIDAGEVMIFDFNVSGLQAGSSVLTLVSTATGNALGSSADWVLVDANANTVVHSTFGVSKGQGSFGNWQVLNSHYRLYMGGAAGHFKLSTLTVDVIAVAATNQPPNITSITPNNSRLVLDWADDLNQGLLAHYDLYRSLTSNDVGFALLASPSASAYTDLAVTNGTTYYYKAKAVSTNGVETAFGNVVSGTPAIPVPTGLVVAPNNQKVALDWNNSTDPMFASFKVWRSLESASNYVNVATLTNSDYADNNVTNGVTYYYKVSQVDTNGNESARTAAVSATPNVPVPTGLTATTDNQQVALHWNVSIDPMFASFKVWRSLISASNYVNIANVATNAYTDTGLTNGVVYYYKLSQLDTNGVESALSAAVAAEPANGTVLIDFRKAGTSVGSASITLSNLGNNPITYAHTADSFGGAGLSSAAKDSFTVPTATGQIVIQGRAYSDDGPLNDGTDDFQPLTWSGGDLTNDFSSTSGLLNSSDAGVGIQDSSGALAVDPGEAILIRFNLSGFTNAAGTSLVLKGVGGDSTGWTLYKRDFNVARGVSGAGVSVLTSGGNLAAETTIAIEDGAIFAFTGARLATLTIDIVATVSGYDAFAAKYGLVGGASGDDDHDGLSNLGEYALNGNPTNGANRGQTSLSQNGSVFTYVYASNTVDSALVYRLIDTANLVYGPFGTNNNTVTGLGPVSGDYRSVTNTYPMTSDKLFINLKVQN